MSEPLTSHEIEDVLSSIRRLVSEDLRPARAAMAAAQAAKVVPVAAPPTPAAEADKLMLTPALRVVPEVAAAPRPVSDPVPEGVAPVAEDVADLAADFAQNFEFAMPARAAVAGAPDGFDGDQADDAGLVTAAPAPAADLAMAFPPPSAEVYDDAGLEEDVALRPMAAVEDDVLWAAPGEADPDEIDLVEDLVTAPAAAAPSHGHWTAQDLPGVDWVEEDADWAEPTPISFVAHPRKPDLTAEPLARAWADRAEEAVRADLSETVSASRGAVPPAGPEQAVPLNPGPQAGTARPPGLFDGDETEVDEEMLREIVRDIIREELAGPLGERITRNVRKLVRVEINRALTAREFE